MIPLSPEREKWLRERADEIHRPSKGSVFRIFDRNVIWNPGHIDIQAARETSQRERSEAFDRLWKQGLRGLDLRRALRERPERAWHVAERGCRYTFLTLCRALEAHGWWIGNGRSLTNGHRSRCLQPYHKQGARGRLRFLTDYYPVGGKFEFYQDHYGENSNGPRYGSRHVKNMDYWTRLTMRHAMAVLREKLVELGYADHSEPEGLTPREEAEWSHLARGWYKPNALPLAEMRQRGNLGWSGKDADGKPVQPGEMKAHYDHQGHLHYGQVFWKDDCGSMLYLVTPSKLLHVSPYQVFTWRPDCRRRSFDRAEHVRRIKDLIHKRVEKMEFEKAIPLREQLRRVEAA